MSKTFEYKFLGKYYFKKVLLPGFEPGSRG